MKLCAKSFGLAGGVLWGVMMFIVTLFGVWMGYGEAFLQGMASVYPGFNVSYVGSLIGLVYGFFDGFVGLFIIAWLYNRFSS